MVVVIFVLAPGKGFRVRSKIVDGKLAARFVAVLPAGSVRGSLVRVMPVVYLSAYRRQGIYAKIPEIIPK